MQYKRPANQGKTNFAHTVQETQEKQRAVDVSIEEREKEMLVEVAKGAGGEVVPPKNLDQMNKVERKKVNDFLEGKLKLEKRKNARRLEEIEARVEAMIND